VTWTREQLPQLTELATQPLPRGDVPVGPLPPLFVGAAPAHPANRVKLLVRDPDGPTRVLGAAPRRAPERAAGSEPALGRAFPYRLVGSSWSAPFKAVGDWFSAALPSVGPGRPLEYRLILERAGQRLAQLPADGSWLLLRPLVPSPGAVIGAEPSGDQEHAGPTAPRWSYDMRFFAGLTANVRPEVVGATPDGYRIDFFIKDGSLTGPGISARLLPEGGDWVVVRTDGTGVLDVRISYRTSQEALIIERSSGMFDLGPEGYATAASGVWTGSVPCYWSSTWETSHPDWIWLNRCQGFGLGEVVMDELQVRRDIYLPALGPAVTAG
jgi:Protein of unknown function (DUF3237)